MTLGPNLNADASPGGLSRKRPVAGYLRSATELEGESPRKQLEAIVRYARDHGMQLIRVYCDECGSGLRIDGRSGVGQMLRDIESGDDDFDAILLSDPSRWGRFHVPDESACLEYVCRATGIEVEYCAEEIAADEPPLSRVIKALKRHMADEYGREAVARGRHDAQAADRDATAPAGGTTPKEKTR